MEENKDPNEEPSCDDATRENGNETEEKVEDSVVSSKVEEAPNTSVPDDSTHISNVSNVAEEILPQHSSVCSPNTATSHELDVENEHSGVKSETSTGESQVTSKSVDEGNKTCSTHSHDPSVVEKQQTVVHPEPSSVPPENDEHSTVSPAESDDLPTGSNTSKRKRDQNVSNGALGVTDVSQPLPVEPLNKRRCNAKNDGQSEEGGDRFCWVCHRDGTIIACATCPRVYHLRCVQLEGVPSEEWVCPECVTILSAENFETRSRAMRQLNVDHLSNLLKYALGRMKAYPGTEPFVKPVDLKEFPRYREFVSHPMDLSQLERNIKRHMYGSTEAFIADTKWILHDCIIFNTHHTKLSSTAKGILKVCKQEMSEIEICPDCYLNAHTRKESWFIEVCRKPHVLLWAKLKGFPFWPAKVMRTSRENMVDVRFFGAHDRAWVPVRDCYLYSRLIPAAARNKKKHNLDACVNEVELHIKKLRERYGRFEYAPFRTPFEPAREPEHLSMFLPTYEDEDGPRLSSGKLGGKHSKRSVGKPPSAPQHDGDTDSSANAKEDVVLSESSVPTSPSPQVSRPLRVYGRVKQMSDPPSPPPTVIQIKQEPEESQKTSALLSDWLRFEQVAAQITLGMSIGSDTEAEESEQPRVNILKFESTEEQESPEIKPNSQEESDSRKAKKKDTINIHIKKEIVEIEDAGEEPEQEQELSSHKTDNEKVDCEGDKGTGSAENTVLEDTSTPLLPETVMKDLEGSKSSAENVECKSGKQDRLRKDSGKSETSDILSKKVEGCKENKETEKLGTVVSVAGENEGNDKHVPDSDMESVNITENDDTSSLSSSSEEVDSEVWDQIEDKAEAEQMEVEAEADTKCEDGKTVDESKGTTPERIRKRTAQEMETVENDEEKVARPRTKLRKQSMEEKADGKRSLEVQLPSRRRSEGDDASLKSGMLPDLIRRLHGSQPRVYLSKVKMPVFHRTYGKCSPLLLGNKKQQICAENQDETSCSSSSKSRPTSRCESSNSEDLVLEHKSEEDKSSGNNDTSIESIDSNSGALITTNDELGKSKAICAEETKGESEDGGSDRNKSETMEHSGKEETEKLIDGENKLESGIIGTEDSEVSMETLGGGVEERSDAELFKLKTRTGEGASEESKEDEVGEEEVRIESSETLKDAEDSNCAHLTEANAVEEPSGESKRQSTTKAVKERRNRTKTAKLARKVESLPKSPKNFPEIQKTSSTTTRKPSEIEASTNNKGEKESDVILSQIKQEPEEVEEANDEEDLLSENENEDPPNKSKEPCRAQTCDTAGDSVNPSYLYPNVTITVENDKQIEVNNSTPAKDCTINIEQVKARVGLPQAISLSVISSDSGTGEEDKNEEPDTKEASASNTKTQTTNLQSPTVPAIVSTSTGYTVTAQNGLEISTQPAEPLPQAPEPALPRSRARKSFPSRLHPQVKITHSFANGLVRGGSGSIMAARRMSSSSMQSTSSEEQLQNSESPMVFIPPSPGRSMNGHSLLVNGERPAPPGAGISLPPLATLPTLAPRLPLAAAAGSTVLADPAGPGRVPFIHMRPPTPSPITAKYPNTVPADVGPATFDLSRHSHKLASYMQQALEDILRDMAAAGGVEATVKMLQLELEKLQWRHQQELAEMKHNADMLMSELRASMATEQQRVVTETLRQCEAEKQRAIEATKKKQWCTNCGKEALFYCCWNTSYCDYPCQQRHWPQHMASCGQAESMKAREATENGHPQSTASLVHHASGKVCHLSSQKILAVPAQLEMAGKGSGATTSPLAFPGPQLQPQQQPQQQRRRAPGAPFSLLPMPRPGSIQVVGRAQPTSSSAGGSSASSNTITCTSATTSCLAIVQTPVSSGTSPVILCHVSGRANTSGGCITTTTTTSATASSSAGPRVPVPTATASGLAPIAPAPTGTTTRTVRPASTTLLHLRPVMATGGGVVRLPLP